MKHNFHVVGGDVVKDILTTDLKHNIDLISAAYLLHQRGDTVNPDSNFLRFPEQQANRIIALPAYIGGDVNISGIKWIASYPDNIKRGLVRASATLTLNDTGTGYPLACLEASHISSVRTAASAVLAARWMNSQKKRCAHVAFVGAGLIARTIFETFHADDWHFGDIGVYDIDVNYAESLVRHIGQLGGQRASVLQHLENTLDADMVVFATNSTTPYVLPPQRLKPGQIVLHISLRDLAPELLFDANNLVDDISHSLRANTSLHLAEQQLGHRAFMTGTLAQLMQGETKIDKSKPLVFSPFGLGILDLALGKHVYERALADDRALPVPHFFEDTQRW